MDHTACVDEGTKVLNFSFNIVSHAVQYRLLKKKTFVDKYYVLVYLPTLKQ